MAALAEWLHTRVAHRRARWTLRRLHRLARRPRTASSARRPVCAGGAGHVTGRGQKRRARMCCVRFQGSRAAPGCGRPAAGPGCPGTLPGRLGTGDGGAARADRRGGRRQACRPTRERAGTARGRPATDSIAAGRTAAPPLEPQPPVDLMAASVRDAQRARNGGAYLTELPARRLFVSRSLVEAKGCPVTAGHR